MKRPTSIELKELKVSQDTAPCTLATEFMAIRPEYTSDAEARNALGQQLETLAGKYGKTIEAFLEEAASSTRHNDDYQLALTLKRQLGFIGK